MGDDKKLLEKINSVLPYLNESQKRIYLASEVKFLGRGGKSRLEKLTGVSHNTINKGIVELETEKENKETQPIRKKGGGRKKKITDEVWNEIQQFVEPHTRGEPESALQWVSKSLRNIESALRASSEVRASYRIIGEALKTHGFSLQSTRKTYEGKGHPDRDKQFEYISKKVKQYIERDQPVISVDAKKRELIGNYQNKGSEWTPKGAAVEVNAYDFPSEAKGVAIPYGVYDLKENKGWVNVGITKDTAEFATQSIRNWWYKMGVYYHNKADSLLITADGGGSNGSRNKLWKYELQKLVNETGLTIEVVHFPPGTSKWSN